MQYQRLGRSGLVVSRVSMGTMTFGREADEETVTLRRHGAPETQTMPLSQVIQALVQEALGRLLRGKTALLIAHRLTTVYRADRILVLDSGRIVQEGKHADLVRRDGVYRRLVGAYTAGGVS